MKVAVLGAGAMGSLVGAHIKKGGGEVYFVDIYEEHMKAVAANGIFMEIERSAETQTVFVDGATTNAEEVGECDAVIILVKCVNTSEAIEKNRCLFGKDTIVVTFQNGVGNAEVLAQHFDADHIGFGMLKASANLFAPGKISGQPRFPYSPKGVYFSPVNWETPYMPKFMELEKLLTDGGMGGECTQEAEVHVWDKLYTNCLYNAIGALLLLANEDSAPHEDGKKLMWEIGREACEVGRAKGFPMDENKYWEVFGGKPSRMPGGALHYTSAVSDSYYKRQTEIDFLNGAIVKEGAKLGIATPYNDAIWRLVRLMQDTYDVRFTPRQD